MSNPRTKYEEKLFKMTEDEHIFKFLTQENPNLATRDAFLTTYRKLGNDGEAVLLSALAYAKQREKYHWEALSTKTFYSAVSEEHRKHKYELARRAVSELKAFISLHAIQNERKGFIVDMNATQRVQVTTMPDVSIVKKTW